MTTDISTPRPLPRRADVVVVGGGYAGLSAALDLNDHGIDVILLEGSDRVGGRTLSEKVGAGAVVDHGGQWVGPTQRHLLETARRFGCEIFPTWDKGSHLELWSDGVIRPFRDAGPHDGPGLSAYEEAVTRLDALAEQIDIENPTAHPSLRDWDSETVESYLRRTVDDEDARARLRLSVQGVWSAEPRDISLFHLLFYIASAGGYTQLMETKDCAQDSRFVDGAQATALAMADHLGDRVITRTRALEIEQNHDGVTVSTDRGIISAARVVVAVSPGALPEIRFTPGLPPARARWIARSSMGDVAKIHVFYDTPFWREDGLSGQATVYGDEAIGVVFDNSPHDGSRGVLVAFVYGDRLRTWSSASAEARQESVLKTLETLFGEKARASTNYFEKIWPDDAWARGGYAGNPAPGLWYEYGDEGWRRPFRRVHWAGTETASVWNGYIDGALSSGRRAADEIVGHFATSSDQSSKSSHTGLV